jgi:thioredoxin-dependent peroxiredoxin
MTQIRMIFECVCKSAALAVVLLVSSAVAGAQALPMAGTTPKVGEKAADFALQSLDGATVRLSEEVPRGPVVLVVLRGWPGYQCPYCTRQYGDFRAHAAQLAATGARVLFVYPGPADGLAAHAGAFAPAEAIPSGFRILLDPDYRFTLAYGLRWDAPNETAYPSAFLVDEKGIVRFARTSREHGGRVTAAAVLDALAILKR